MEVLKFLDPHTLVFGTNAGGSIQVSSLYTHCPWVGISRPLFMRPRCTDGLDTFLEIHILHRVSWSGTQRERSSCLRSEDWKVDFER